MASMREMGSVQPTDQDVNALLAKALQHVVEGNHLARYVGRSAADVALKAMCDRFVKDGANLDDLLRRRLVAGLSQDNQAGDRFTVAGR
jgi:hypothetical protein